MTWPALTEISVRSYDAGSSERGDLWNEGYLESRAPWM